MPDKSDLVQTSVRSRVVDEQALKRSRARQVWYFVLAIFLAFLLVILLTALGVMPY